MIDLQKANMTKRISALIFDLIIIAILTVGFGELISLITGYDKHYNAWYEGCQTYEKQYGITLFITEDEYNLLSDEKKEIWLEASSALEADAVLMKEYMLSMYLTIVIISAGLLISVLIWDFIIPLKLGNGMTLGKKIFATGVMRTDQVKISPLILFIRAILGKYTIELMIPILVILLMVFNNISLTGIITLFLITVIQFVSVTATKNHSAIHDLFAGTVVVDFPSQKIYESKEERDAAFASEASEKASQKPLY